MVPYWFARAEINDPVEYNQNIQAFETISIPAQAKRPGKVDKRKDWHNTLVNFPWMSHCFGFASPDKSATCRRWKALFEEFGCWFLGTEFAEQATGSG